MRPPPKPVTFKKDGKGRVYLRGRAESNAPGKPTGAIFVLPPDHRPKADWVFTILTSDGPGECTIRPSGDILITKGSGSWFQLDGIFFETVEPPSA